MRRPLTGLGSYRGTRKARGFSFERDGLLVETGRPLRPRTEPKPVKGTKLKRKL
jgi:hypothetical protein